jgi:hypothetical protein
MIKIPAIDAVPSAAMERQMREHKARHRAKTGEWKYRAICSKIDVARGEATLLISCYLRSTGTVGLQIGKS